MTGNSAGEHHRMAGHPLDFIPCATKKVQLLLLSRSDSISLEVTPAYHGMVSIVFCPGPEMLTFSVTEK